MYGVSDKYKQARKKSVQRYRMHGTIAGSDFDDRNILSGSFSITNQCSDETQVLIGQVYIAELKMTLIGFDAKRYTLKNAKIIPVFGMKISGDEYEDVPLGVFTISDAQWGTSGIAITAYDNMSLLDRSFSAVKLTGTAFELLELACKNCGLTFGMSESDFDNIPNGNAKFTLDEDNDITTWRDLVGWIAQACACNAFTDRSGRLVLRCYNQNVVDTIDDMHRLSGCTFNDYETRYTGLYNTVTADETAKYYGDSEDDGLTYDLGTNPLLQAGVNIPLDTMCQNILTALLKIQYVPFKVEMIGDPAFDLMDVIRFTGGVADASKISCITKFTFNYNSKFSIEGVGKNPALITGNSKGDKDISGLISKVESVTDSINKLLYDFNTGPMTVTRYERMIGTITFYASQQTDVEGHFLMTYSASEATHLIIRFYDTTVEELFSPCELDIIEGGGGTIGIPHAYLERTAGVHSLTVTAQCTSGELYVDTRGMFFSIDAGNYVESLNDLTMDIRDISMRQLQEENGPDQIWAIGIENNELLVAERDYSERSTARYNWSSLYDLGKAKDAAIEFNGYWVRKQDDEVFTLVTEDQPWMFWIDESDNLIAQKGEDETSKIQLDAGVSCVHACRGYKSEYDLSMDQGLVVVYIKNGHVWYRQWLYFKNADITKWDEAYEVDAEITDAEHCSIARLNDYRLAVTIRSASQGTKIYITERTYVNQAVPREDVSLCDGKYFAIATYPNGYDTSIQVLSQSVSDDLLTLQVTYNRLFKIADGSSIDMNCEVGGVLKTDSPNEKVKEMAFEADEESKTTTLTVKLKEKADSTDLKFSYSVLLNSYEGKTNPNFWVKLDEWGYASFDTVTATWDVDRTNYIEEFEKETTAFPAALTAGTIDFYVVGKLKGTENDGIDFSTASVTATTDLIKKGIQSGEESGDTADLSAAGITASIEYYDKNSNPI